MQTHYVYYIFYFILFHFHWMSSDNSGGGDGRTTATTNIQNGTNLFQINQHIAYAHRSRTNC